MSRPSNSYHIQRGIAHPHESRVVFRQSHQDGGYLAFRGTYSGGEEVTRIITRTKRRDGYTITDSLAFRNPLHARAWLGLMHQETR